MIRRTNIFSEKASSCVAGIVISTVVGELNLLNMGNSNSDQNWMMNRLQHENENVGDVASNSLIACRNSDLALALPLELKT